MKKVKYLLFILMLASCSQNTSTSYNSSSSALENTISSSSNLISSTDDVSSSSSSVSSSSSSTSLNLSTTTKDSTSSSIESISNSTSSSSEIVTSSSTGNVSTSSSSSVVNDLSSSSQVNNSPIKSLTAVSEVVELKVDETQSIANYYELQGYKSLSAKQKEVIVTSSDETVLTISSNYKVMTAISVGTAIVTVTSTVDETKFCTFTVNVSTSSSSSQVDNSPIKSLTAVSEVVELKVGETQSIVNYYDLKGHKSLTAKQKKVIVTSSDETVLTISSNYKLMTAISVGTAIVTVTSTVDETKFCTFTVNVTDSFFDREIVSMSPSWDLTHENDEINPYIKIDTDLSSGIFAKEINDTKWFIETEMTMHSILYNEQNSKVGIVTDTFNNNGLSKKMFFYLDAPISKENEWNTFGVTELKLVEDFSTSIGYKTVITQSNDNIYTDDEFISYDKTFKIGMLRDNLNFYLYVNGDYVYTFEATSELFDFTPSKVGFFSFSTEITFSNYYIIKDEIKLNEMIELI